MKVALLITTYNRPQYLRQCLWSLERADLSRVDKVIIVDDCSTDNETHKLISNFIIKIGKTISFVNDVNSGIKHSLLVGYEYAFSSGYDIVINLDSDAIVRPDFVYRLLEIKELFYNNMLTGFHCITKNTNGSDRHPIIEEVGYNGNHVAYRKKSVGGINLCINKTDYELYVKSALPINGNWDANACINSMKYDRPIMCLKQSVIQHIGFESSMGHNEPPDVADDFYYWDLPDVTLIGVDNQPQRLKTAIDICTKWIKFGDVKQITHSITSKEQYSEFCIKELYKHVNTSHILICQHDGYVHNWQAWDNDWLQYDYIGAPWHYTDGYSVGNGGFSLRSRRLMQIVANDPNIQFHHPEDHHICRTYRPYLESTYGIKFAPIEVAEKFSFEGYLQPDKQLSDQFGKHGNKVVQQHVKRDRYVVNQYQGAGDILFLVPMIRALLREGNSVIWPIVPHYMDLAKHFPDLDMRNMNYVKVPYESAMPVETQYGRLLPYRFAMERTGNNMTKCMQSKYTMYNHDWHMWRELYYKRFPENEQALKELVGADGEYILVNRHYGDPSKGMQITPNLPDGVKVIEMRTISGYSLIDWLGVIEGAKEIHTANTSIMYLLELMRLDKPVYVYKRGTWGEVAFEHTRELWENKDFIFVV